MEPNPPPGEQNPLPVAASRRRSILLMATGLALALLATLVALYGPTLWRIVQQRNATLVLPPEAAGLRLVDNDQARTTADYLSTTLAAGLPLDQRVAGIYADTTDPTSSVILAGGTAVLRDPERDLDQAFQLLTDGAKDLEALRPVPPGELGGVMKCAGSPDAEVPMAICGWADHGTVVMAMFPGRSSDESADLLRTLRAAIQRR